MAFLFGKKNKNVDKALREKDGSGGVAGSQTSFQPTANGRMNEKSQQSSTPGSSVNNSITSLQGGGGTATPSPEQVNGRRAPITDQASDLPVSVSWINQSDAMAGSVSREVRGTFSIQCEC
jgi:hypothetical protein